MPKKSGKPKKVVSGKFHGRGKIKGYAKGRPSPTNHRLMVQAPEDVIQQGISPKDQPLRAKTKRLPRTATRSAYGNYFKGKGKRTGGTVVSQSKKPKRKSGK